MNTHKRALQRSIDYIEESFKKDDLLACVLVNRRTGAVLQRLETTTTLAAFDFQRWLHTRNDQGFDVYVSMNALHPNAFRRTKQDIVAIRHLYLDFDADGTASVARMKRESNLPVPNYELSTSPGKCQVVWRVNGFTKDQAEALQRSLAREWRADPAATDCARVMRLPGFFNHKYSDPYLIEAEKLSDGLSSRKQFPVPNLARAAEKLMPERRSRVTADRPVELSQSERDWAFAKRSLARGDAPEKIVQAIAAFRSGEKPNPRYYAEHTVSKARQALQDEKRVGLKRRSPEEFSR